MCMFDERVIDCDCLRLASSFLKVNHSVMVMKENFCTLICNVLLIAIVYLGNNYCQNQDNKHQDKEHVSKQGRGNGLVCIQVLNGKSSVD